MLFVLASLAVADSAFAAPDVYLFEAPGEQVCETAHNKHFGEGKYAMKFKAPEDGCYRLDAHSGSEECGFGSAQDIGATWCMGKSAALTYSQRQGWSHLGTWFLYAAWPAFGVTQDAGPVDAFRFVYLGPQCDESKLRAGEFAKLHLEVDIKNVPSDFVEKVAEMVEGWAIVHGISEGSVVVELELLKGVEPTAAQVAAAAQGACALLGFKGPECAESAQLSPPPGSPKDASPRSSPYNVASGNAPCSSCANGRSMVLALVFGFPAGLAAVFFAVKYARQKYEQAQRRTTKKVTVRAVEEAVEEGKLGQPLDDDFDDNASTCTPNSIPSVSDRKIEDIPA